MKKRALKKGLFCCFRPGKDRGLSFPSQGWVTISSFNFKSPPTPPPTNFLQVPYFCSLQPTRGQWQKVFYLSAIIYVIGAISYLILGSGEEQIWNTPEDELYIQIDIPREEREPLPVFRNSEEPEDAASKPGAQPV